MDVLHRIKRLMIQGKYHFTQKASDELALDELDRADAVEAIVNSTHISKVLRSRSPFRGRADEKLYVIEGFSYGGTLIYTKGKISREAGEEVYYIFISSKRSTYGSSDEAD